MLVKQQLAILEWVQETGDQFVEFEERIKQAKSHEHILQKQTGNGPGKALMKRQ